MARRGRDAGLALLAALAAAAAAFGPCAAQLAALPSCPPAPISLSPCIGYVFGVGSATATLASCCAQFQAFFQAQGPCLCAASKLAPSPFGLFLGQAQAIVPNVCNLPSHPCDDDVAGASTVPVTSTPPVVSATTPATPLAPTAPAPATTPASTPASPSTTLADPDSSVAPPATAAGDPAGVAAPGQVTPAGAESNTGSQVASKMPELLHSAAAGRSSGSVFIALFLACVSAMYV